MCGSIGETEDLFNASSTQMPAYTMEVQNIWASRQPYFAYLQYF